MRPRASGGRGAAAALLTRLLAGLAGLAALARDEPARLAQLGEERA